MNLIKQILNKQRGFTLVEMVVVIAIMGVMAAVAVPVVTNNISKSKATAFAQDLAMIQTAVDSYFTAADNSRHLGLRQYPINAREATGGSIEWVDVLNVTEPLANPLLGTQGGQPYWRDNGNGIRDARDGGPAETISLVTTVDLDTPAPGADSWYLAKVELQGAAYAVDTRGFFIDFDELIEQGLLKAAPESASTDNGGVATGGGSYSWFVNANGSVDAILVDFPYNGLNLDDGIIGDPITDTSTIPPTTASDLRGFQEGIYP